jgi:predicted nucleotidyltransferase
MSGIIDWDKTLPIWKSMPAVLAVWAFGSAQGGALREGSDADVGVLLTHTPPFEEQLALLGRLQDALQMDEIDLIILNDANPILRFEAVSGRQLFNRDPEEVAGFVSLTAREYEDEMAQWEHAMRHYRRASP